MIRNEWKIQYCDIQRIKERKEIEICQLRINCSWLMVNGQQFRLIYTKSEIIVKRKRNCNIIYIQWIRALLLEIIGRKEKRLS